MFCLLLCASLWARGDVNEDQRIDLSDAVAISNYLFEGGSGCGQAMDVNSDEEINITDVVFLTNYLFLNGPDPAPPSLECMAPACWLPSQPVRPEQDDFFNCRQGEFGDENADGVIDFADVVSTVLYLEFEVSTTCTENIDMDQDGLVELEDAILIWEIACNVP